MKDYKILVDDTILVKDMVASAGSRILEGYKPLFSAEAVTRLEKEGCKVTKKTNLMALIRKLQILTYLLINGCHLWTQQ